MQHEDQVGPSQILAEILNDSVFLFLKKLSCNDRGWANENPTNHQVGPYIPAKIRQSDFFPQLEAKSKDKPKPIYEVEFETKWPQTSETKKSRLVHYTSKGSETHLTRVPRKPFANLNPASFFVIAKKQGSFVCLTVDSFSDDYNFLESYLDIKPDFESDVFDIGKINIKNDDKIEGFIRNLIRHYLDGKISQLASAHCEIPPTSLIAEKARALFLTTNCAKSLNPFLFEKPGDVLVKISREIELEIFKEYQFYSNVIKLVRLILGDVPAPISLEKIIRLLAENYEKVDRLLLIGSQQRKARAGYSFEHHIAFMLTDGHIPFEKQVVLEDKKRPDFLLPSYDSFKKGKDKSDKAIVLSAKTTLRDRWKQVFTDHVDGDVFLCTVDEKISGSAIQEMQSLGITLIVPEMLHMSINTEYSQHSNVMTFKNFFEVELREKRFGFWGLA